MHVIHLVAGAAGMYCGSCLHDNRLVATLRAQGRDVLLVPLYTPLRTDEQDVSERRLYYGGLNVYLQQNSVLFRHTPRFLDRLLDARVLLRALGRLAGRTRAEELGALTVSVLEGPAGAQRKELARLIAGLRRLEPRLVHLPNLMFVGVARTLKAALNVPVVCGLAGEDIFLDDLPEPHRQRAFDLIRTGAADVDAFDAPTAYYARHAAEQFGLPPERIHHIPMGIRVEDFAAADPPRAPFTIGYLARVCPAKGLLNLARALVKLHAAGRDVRVRAAGYLGPADRSYLERVREELRAFGVPGDVFEYVGEVTRAEKIAFLRTLHVLSVPTEYVESKGFYVLESLAAGVPVVQPAHGSFPELLAATGGGLLYDPRSPETLAGTLARLMDDEPQRRRLAEQGRAAVQASFTADRAADAMWRLYERLAPR